MLLTLLITAILVAILAGTLLDQDDQCGFNTFVDRSQAYKFFGTKTTYTAAFEKLNPSSHQNSDLPELFHSRPSHPEFANLQELSLKSIDARLRENQCKPRQLHFFGRHAARYPNSEDMEKINTLVNEVKDRIELSSSAHKPQPSSTPSSDDASNPSRNNTFCFNPLTPFKQWSPRWFREQGNMIMRTGYEESDNIAERLKKIYPEFFDASKAEVDIGTTDELRTLQTALVFMKQIQNFSPSSCSLEDLPTDTSDTTKTQEILNNPCYKKLINEYKKEKLNFHKICERVAINNNTLKDLDLNNPKRYEFISQSVSKKLKLPEHRPLETNQTKALYKACKFETALTGSSIWCDLFTDRDLKFYEYLDDVDDYLNQALGTNYLYESSCPVTSDLINEMISASKDPDFKHKAFYHFSHSQVIQRILAASAYDQLYDEKFSKDNVASYLASLTVPQSRRWRSSLFSPFSANIEYILYDCSASEKMIGFWIIAALNEKPFKMFGCNDMVCSLNDLLMNQEGISRYRKCKMETICRSTFQYS